MLGEAREREALFSVLHWDRLHCRACATAPLRCSCSASDAGGVCPLCCRASRAGAEGGSPPHLPANKWQMGRASAPCSAAALPPRCARPCCLRGGSARTGSTPAPPGSVLIRSPARHWQRWGGGGLHSWPLSQPGQQFHFSKTFNFSFWDAEGSVWMCHAS